jgi:hypothetical protein
MSLDEYFKMQELEVPRYQYGAIYVNFEINMNNSPPAARRLITLGPNPCPTATRAGCRRQYEGLS